MAVPAPGPPIGWSFASGGGGTTRAGTDHGAFPAHTWYDFAAVLETPIFTSSAVANITIWASIALEKIGPVGDIIQVYGPASIGGQLRVCTLKQESDNTISFYVAGSPDVLSANTGPVPLTLQLSDDGQYQRWYNIQLNLQISSVNVGGTLMLSIQMDLAINGTPVLSRSTVSNSIPASAFAHLGANQIQFIGGNLGLSDPFVADLMPLGDYPQGIWAITVTAPGSGYNPATTVVTFSGGSGGSGESAFPEVHPITGAIDGILFLPGFGWTVAPAVTITDTGGGGSGATAVATLVPAAFVRESQGVMEIAIQQNDAEVRMSQGAMEIAIKQNTSDVRSPQMVIELATLNQQAKWNVTEA